MITHSERHKVNEHPNHIQNQSISGGIVAVYSSSIDFNRLFPDWKREKGSRAKKEQNKKKRFSNGAYSAVYCVLPNLRTHFNRVSLSLSFWL